MSSRLYDADPAPPIAPREPTPARHIVPLSARWAGARWDDTPSPVPDAGAESPDSSRSTAAHYGQLALDLTWACLVLLCGLAGWWGVVWLVLWLLTWLMG